MPFHQDPPRLPEDPFGSDDLLQATLQRHLDADVLDDVRPELEDLGRRAVGEIAAWGDDALADEPALVRYGPWGRRIDRLDVADGWRRLKDISAELGLVADAYDRPWGASSRLIQAAKVHLFHPSSATYTCPLAMTDGAAKVLAEQGGDADQDLGGAFEHLTSRDPETFWTAGQWMTERAGGSDVSRTGTVARPGDDGTWRLFGDKWFTSATLSQVAFTLARIEGDGGTVPGSDGLGLFFVRLRDDDGDLQDIRIRRLKDKLGTRALPTAELTLDGTPAVLVGERGEGVRRIATILNVTRIWNALSAVADLRRGLDLAEDYATRREAFGRKLADLPLHVETLADLEVTYAACFTLTFETARLLGRVEAGEGTDAEQRRLRLLTPLVKLYTAKEAIAATSETLECFGGPGYIEDTGLPRRLRDAQVLSIWEGTTNVLALDAVRALAREKAGPALLSDVADRLAAADADELAGAVDWAETALLNLEEHVATLEDRDGDDVQAGARRLAYGLARTYAAALLVDHAQWCLQEGHPTAEDAVEVAERWCRRDLTPLRQPDKRRRAASRRIAFGE